MAYQQAVAADLAGLAGLFKLLPDLLHPSPVLAQIPVPQACSRTDMDNCLMPVQQEQAIIDKTKQCPELNLNCILVKSHHGGI